MPGFYRFLFNVDNLFFSIFFGSCIFQQQYLNFVSTFSCVPYFSYFQSISSFLSFESTDACMKHEYRKLVLYVSREGLSLYMFVHDFSALAAVIAAMLVIEQCCWGVHNAGFLWFGIDAGRRVCALGREHPCLFLSGSLVVVVFGQRGFTNATIAQPLW